MSEFIVTVNSKKKNVKIPGNSIIYVNDIEYNQELYYLSGDTYMLKVNNKMYEISAGRIDHERYSVSIDGKNLEVLIRTSLQEKAAKLGELKAAVTHKMERKAAMPGLVLKIKKQAGDSVVQGESVMILEAMKMENDVRAQVSGKIKSINVKEGMAVEKGFTLFTIE
ncbi:MAG: biotin/lipoyl-binding protein [Ignavibacteriaceae bacterium]|nr:biotin/lipoyl-binding protein [Ignavibacteriaceae bacterium]